MPINAEKQNKTRVECGRRWRLVIFFKGLVGRASLRLHFGIP